MFGNLFRAISRYMTLQWIFSTPLVQSYWDRFVARVKRKPVHYQVGAAVVVVLVFLFMLFSG